MNVHRSEHWTDSWIDEEARAYVRSLARTIASGDENVADDLEQEVMLIVLANQPREHGAWRAWIRSVTRNTFRYRRYRSSLRPTEFTDLHASLDALQGREGDPSITLSQDDLRDRLERLLDDLPTEYREVIRLRAVEEQPPRKVASALGIPVETVRTRYRRGLAMLRDDAERALGSDSLGEWQAPAWLLALLPRRRRSALFGATAATAGIGLLLVASAAREPDSDTPLPVERPSASTTGAIVQEVVPPPTRGAARGGGLDVASHASASLRLRDELGAPLGKEMVYLRGPDEDVVAWRTDDEGRADLDRLAPGEWTAWARGVNLGSRWLGQGDNAWDLQYQKHIPVFVQVHDEAGRPAQGVEVFCFNDDSFQVTSVGISDAAGHVEATVERSNTWLAARGDAGLSSRASYVDQPRFQVEGSRIDLHLRKQKVRWRSIQFDETTAASDRRIVARPKHRSVPTNCSVAEGVTRVGVWLPPWLADSGAFGTGHFTGGRFMALTGEEIVWWLSNPHRKNQPLRDALFAESPIRITGRLLDPEGLPLAGRLVHQGDRQMAGEFRISARTDESGRFALETCGGKQIRLSAGSGRWKTVSRPEQGGHLEIGDWHLSKRVAVIELENADQPWTCTPVDPLFHRERPRTQPTSEESFGSRVVSGTGPRAVIPLAAAVSTRMVVVEAGSGCVERSALVLRPKGGWLGRTARVDLADALPVSLSASVDPSRLPIRGVWREEESEFTSPAIPDAVTGRVGSAPLPAGRWSLDALDRDGARVASAVTLVTPGYEHDFGVLESRSGGVRVSLASFDAGSMSPGGTLRILDYELNTSVLKQLPEGELLPFEVNATVRDGEHQVILKLGDRVAVGRVRVPRGGVAEADLSTEQFFVGLASASRVVQPRPWPTLVLRNQEGTELWRHREEDERGRDSEALWVLVPRLEGARLFAEDLEGCTEEPILPARDHRGSQFLSRKQWYASGD